MSHVVVIGGGHNGLVAAALLARAGREVTVLEAGNEPGGCIWTETTDSGHRLERGAVEHGGIVGLAEELDLARFGLTFARGSSIGGAAFGDGEVVRFEISAEATAEAFGDDRGAYVEFATLADRLFAMIDAFPVPPTPSALAAQLGGIAGGEDLFRLIVSSCEAVLERRFADRHLRSALAMHGAHGQMPPWAPGTGMFSMLVPSGHGSAPARPVGGSRALIDALAAALADAGGRLVTGAKVRAITQDGRGARVRFGDDGDLHADVVVSTLDVRRTVGLLDDAPAELAEAARGMASGRLNVGELKVDLALDHAPDLGPLGDRGGALWMLQDAPDSLRRAFGDIVAGRLPDELPVMFTLPSLADPTAAPQGQSSVWVSAFVPLRPRQPWESSLADEAAERALATVARVTGADLTRGVVAQAVTPPTGWAQRIHSADGNPNHLDLSLDQLLGWRPPAMAGCATPLPWLYLSGAGTHPGGGLTGSPGRAAASAVLAGQRGSTRRVSELKSLLAGWRLYRSMRRGV